MYRVGNLLQTFQYTLECLQKCYNPSYDHASNDRYCIPVQTLVNHIIRQITLSAYRSSSQLPCEDQYTYYIVDRLCICDIPNHSPIEILLSCPRIL